MSESKRILFLSPQPFFVERGTPIRASQFLRAFSEAGYEVDLLCYPFGRDLDVPGVRIHRSWRIPGIRSVKIGPSLAKVPLDFVMFVHAFLLCVRGRYDVMCAVEESGFFAGILKRLFGCRLVYHMDSMISEHLEYSGFLGRRNPLLWLATWLERRTIRLSDGIVTVSQDIADKVTARDPGVSVRVIEDCPIPVEGSDLAERVAGLRAEFGYPEDEVQVVVYTGNTAGYQGVELLIRAFSLLVPKFPQVRLAVVGALGICGAAVEIERERLESLARDHHCLSVCRFTGGRPVEEIPAWLELADVVVSPRISGTNTPLKIYSYMMGPAPIVATDLPVHTHVLTPECAVLAKPDPESFAQGMECLLTRPDLGRALAARAREVLDLHYGTDRFRRQAVAAVQAARG